MGSIIGTINRKTNIRNLSNLIRKYLLEMSCNNFIEHGNYEQNDGYSDDCKNNKEFRSYKKFRIYKLALELSSIDKAINIIATEYFNDDDIFNLLKNIKQFMDKNNNNKDILKKKILILSMKLNKKYMFTSNEKDEENSNYEEDFNEENSNNEEDNKSFSKKNILNISKKFKCIKNIFFSNEEDEENSNYEEDKENSNNEEDINEEDINIDDYSNNEGFEKDVINTLYFLTIKYFGIHELFNINGDYTSMYEDEFINFIKNFVF